ncbi:MAG: lipoyl(octanoyl) transferase LipB [Phycisphaerales bacterium]|nr:lipoyl(octanoyl) transferase LipB [Phycisphaerales bacterium]
MAPRPNDDVVCECDISFDDCAWMNGWHTRRVVTRLYDREVMSRAHEPPLVEVVDLGDISYAAAYDLQRAAHERVVASRGAIDAPFSPAQRAGVIYVLEHTPAVVTVSRRADAQKNVLLSRDQLAARAIECVETDRGGDVTWHGPGQIVVYLILDLNRLGLRVHGYLRMLEGAVIATLADFDVTAQRDAAATGVWVGHPDSRKICAMGVRLSRWVSMHGIALNVSCDLNQFEVIVPCGLAGRGVTSLARELGARAPTVAQVKEVLVFRLQEAISAAARAAAASHTAQ